MNTRMSVVDIINAKRVIWYKMEGKQLKRSLKWHHKENDKEKEDQALGKGYKQFDLIKNLKERIGKDRKL